MKHYGTDQHVTEVIMMALLNGKFKRFVEELKVCELFDQGEHVGEH